MKILVTGLNVFESGKSWTAIALYKAAMELGHSPAVFKPVGAFDIWYGYLAYLESLKRRSLLGNDVLMYEKYLNVTDLETINPINVALAPLNPEFYRLKKDLDGYYRDMQNFNTQAIIARTTDCEKKVSTHTFFIDNMSTLARPLQEKIRNLIRHLNATPMNLNEFLNFVSSMYCEQMLISCMNVISTSSDLLIIESFNDSVTPFGKALVDSDYIIVVSPSMLYIYRNSDYIIKFIEDEFARLGMEALRTNTLIRKIDPNLTYELEPYESPVDSVSFYKMILENLIAQVS